MDSVQLAYLFLLFLFFLLDIYCTQRQQINLAESEFSAAAAAAFLLASISLLLGNCVNRFQSTARRGEAINHQTRHKTDDQQKKGKERKRKGEDQLQWRRHVLSSAGHCCFGCIIIWCCTLSDRRSSTSLAQVFCAVYNRLFICRRCCCCCLNFIFIALRLALAPAPGMKVLRQAVFCLCVPSFWLAGCILLLLLFLAVTSFTHWLAGWLAFYRAKFCLALIIWCCCCKKVNICHFCELSERFEQRGGEKLAVMLLLLILLLLQNVLFLSFFSAGARLSRAPSSLSPQLLLPCDWLCGILYPIPLSLLLLFSSSAFCTWTTL